MEPREHPSVSPADGSFFEDRPAIVRWVSSVAPAEPRGSQRFLARAAAPAPSSQPWADLIHLTDLRNNPLFSDANGAGYSTVIIDSGIDLDHPFFGPDDNNDGVSDRIVYQHDFANNDDDASDRSGHGTNVASLAAGDDSMYPGVASGASVIVLKVFTDAGTGNFVMIEDALRWVIAHVQQYNIVSVNLSLGDNRNYTTPQHLYGVSDEFQTLAERSVKVIASAGNSFYRFDSAVGVGYPAADPSVLAVGAVFPAKMGAYTFSSGAEAYDSEPDALAPFSQRGSTIPSIFAPGVSMIGAAIGGGASAYTGTSQAAPVVAGLAVIADQLAERFLGRRLSVPEFRVLLQETGRAIVDGDDEQDNVTNTGNAYTRIDAEALAIRIMSMGNTPTNNPPSLTSVATLTRGQAGAPYVVTYERLLAAATTTDPDGDAISFRVEQVQAGTLLKNGVAITPGATTLSSGESLVWIPASVHGGATNAFSIVAFDGQSASTTPRTVTIDAGPRLVGYTTRAERLVRFTPIPARTNCEVVDLPVWARSMRDAEGPREGTPRAAFVQWIGLLRTDERVARIA